MSNQWKLCESCVQRHCNKAPVQVTLTATKRWRCTKYRKHQSGFKLEEVVRYIGEQRDKSRTNILQTKGE